MRLVFMGTPGAAVPTLKRCLEDGHEVVARGVADTEPAAYQQADEAARKAKLID